MTLRLFLFPLLWNAVTATVALPQSPFPELPPTDRSGWLAALPGWRYEFPRDHRTHDGFRTEWWYVTGNLRAADGRKFGYQFTVFRRGVRPPGDRPPAASRWVVDDLPLGHFTLTDVSARRFYYAQNLERGAFGTAGFSSGANEPRLAWIGDSFLRLEPDGTFRLQSLADGTSLALTLKSARAPVFHGQNGVSQKSAGIGHASHYYSLTRLESAGTVTLGGETVPVTGLSWLDREWATNQLAPDQTGWDWFSLHLGDGRDLMLYQLRRGDGSRDPFSSGTLVGVDGVSVALKAADFTVLPVPGKTWTSDRTGGEYPVLWRLHVPGHGIELEVAPVFPEQELALKPVTYWEGAVTATGPNLTAQGYLEMTGYAGALRALRAP